MIVLPIYIKKATDKTADTDATMTVVNNVFAHWLKEVDIKHYPMKYVSYQQTTPLIYTDIQKKCFNIYPIKH